MSRLGSRRKDRSAFRQPGDDAGLKDLERVGKPLQMLLDGLGLGAAMDAWRAVELWSEVVDARAAAKTRALSVRDGELWVEVDSATWMNELTYAKPRVIREINRRLGGERIKNVRFVPASAEPRERERRD